MSDVSTLPSPTPIASVSTRVRWAAVAYGLLLAIAVNSFNPVSGYLIHSSSFANSHMPLSILFGILLPAYLYNPIVRRRRPSWALTRKDLAAALSVGFLGGAVPSMAGRFLSVISAPEYFASPENEWPIYVLPNIQDWLYPKNTGNGIGMFYSGLQPGADIPWGIWVGPLVAWLGFVGCIILACFCLQVILRKQWVEHERLAYPLVELSLLLVDDPPDGRRLPAFFQERLFWIGFGIPAFMILWNTFGHFNPGFPVFSFLNRNNLLPVGRGFLDFFIRFDPYVICFAYFTPLNILLSMWFFHVLAMVQSGISIRVGFGPQGYGAGTWTQNAWALTVFVIWGLWMARRQFRDVANKAFGRAPDVDDSEELLSYRAAFFGFCFSVLFIFLWLLKTNMGPGVALAYMFVTLILYLGMAKIVALSGLIAIRGSGPGVAEFIDIRTMDDSSLAALNQVQGALYSYAKGFAMTGAAEAVRSADHAEPGRRRLGVLIPLAGFLGVVAFLLVTLYLGYTANGAENFGDYSYTTGNRHFYNYTVTAIKDRSELQEEWWSLIFGVFGAVSMAALIALNQRVPWWPLHPVGYTVSIQYPTRASFFSIFVAWLIKYLIVRIGGIGLYSRSRILFIGVLIGYTFSVLVSFVLDTFFFFGQGHGMHTPPI